MPYFYHPIVNIRSNERLVLTHHPYRISDMRKNSTIQKISYHNAKGDLLEAHRSCIATQKVTYRNGKHILLIFSGLGNIDTRHVVWIVFAFQRSGHFSLNQRLKTSLVNVGLVRAIANSYSFSLALMNKEKRLNHAVQSLSPIGARKHSLYLSMNTNRLSGHKPVVQ